MPSRVTENLLARRFLLSLNMLLNPRRPEDPPVDPAAFDRLPRARLVGEWRNMVCEFEFMAPDELRIALKLLPAAHLHLSREGRTSRFLGRLGLSREVQIGEKEFDERYLIQHISRKDARALFNPRVRQLVDALEPFFNLEMLAKELRVLKYAPLREGYEPASALHDLETLFELHLATRSVDLPDAGLKR
jgi:hypothetical protein